MNSYCTYHAFILLLLCFALLISCEDQSNDDKPDLPSCPERAVFGDHQQSEYILPWPADSAYQLIQSYCNPFGSHGNQLAYDFDIPVGDYLLAARDGVVRELREDLPDNGVAINSSIHNHLNIEHADGSVAFYAHLKQQSVFVEAGQSVSAGDTIAQSGNSGATGGTPHLHFGVYRTWPPVEGDDLPVNFRNCSDTLDINGGLVSGQWYKALSL